MPNEAGVVIVGINTANNAKTFTGINFVNSGMSTLDPIKLTVTIETNINENHINCTATHHDTPAPNIKGKIMTNMGNMGAA